MKKLVLYEHQIDKTMIDTYHCESWDDFLFVKVGGADLEDAAGDLGSLLRERFPDKKILFFREGTEISLYGVEPEQLTLFDIAGVSNEG